MSARHLHSFDPVHFGPGEWVVHRIDVKFDNQQWCVNILTGSESLNAERELAPALACLNYKLEEFDCELGEIIHSGPASEWHSKENKQIRNAWNAIGDGSLAHIATA